MFKACYSVLKILLRLSPHSIFITNTPASLHIVQRSSYALPVAVIFAMVMVLS